MDREKVIKGLYDIGGFVVERIGIEQARNFIRTIDDACAMLKKQDDLLRKLQKDKDKLCLEVSEWKHKFHDRPMKEQDERINELELEKGWDESPDMMGK